MTSTPGPIWTVPAPSATSRCDPIVAQRFPSPGASGLAGREPINESDAVNLHDWIDELCDVLDLDIEVDEGLLLDLASTAAHNVERPAAPISTYLLGYAAGAADADLDAVEKLAGRVQALAEGWDRPAGTPDPDDVDDDGPDDSVVDHTGETFDD